MRVLALSLAMLFAIAAAQDQPRRLTLAEALTLAEQNSPSLKAAIADLGAARAAAKAAKSETLPKVSANGFATSGNNASIISSSPMVDPPAWMMVPAGAFFDANLMLMVPILVPRNNAMVTATNWQVKAAEAELTEARADLSLTVIESFDRVLLARRVILAEEAKVTASTELVRTTQALFEAGKGIEATVHRAQAELSRAQRALTTARNEEAKAVVELQAIIGLDFAPAIEPSGDFDTAAPEQLTEYLRRGKASRGLLLAARAKLVAASAEVRAAEGQRAPQLYGVAMGDATNRGDMGGVTAGLTLSFPLFDGGRISAEASRARSMRSKAEAQVREAELTVEKEIRQAYLDVHTAMANAESAKLSVTAAQSAYDVTALRVQAGKSILVEQLDALEALTRARADLAQALFDQTVAAARLRRAAGGVQ
jgi:outer membrane protein